MASISVKNNKGYSFCLSITPICLLYVWTLIDKLNKNTGIKENCTYI